MKRKEQVLGAALELAAAVERLRFSPPVSHWYNPLRYAFEAHRLYVERYAGTPKRVVFLGMNPGPFGMAQTGVPFGDPVFVREWLRIEAPVGRPEREHPKRPVEGFLARRRELSGRRLWGAIAGRFAQPERFFEQYYVANYCPLLFLEESGRNRTPDRLPKAEREPLFQACDRHLRRVVAALEPKWVVGIGRFAVERARRALGDDEEVKIGWILHPSPANPQAGPNWASRAEEQLHAQGICHAGVRRSRRHGPPREPGQEGDWPM